jgi:hypothetical protein
MLSARQLRAPVLNEPDEVFRIGEVVLEGKSHLVARVGPDEHNIEIR